MNIFLKSSKSAHVFPFNSSFFLRYPSHHNIKTLKPLYFLNTSQKISSDPKNIDSNEIFIEKVRRRENKPQPKSLLIFIYDIAEITKFKLSLANSSVALTAYLLISPTIDSKLLLFFTATQMIAMSSQTSNQDLEKDYDKLMIRTCNRPLPKNRIEPKYARMIAGSLYICSNLLFFNYFPINALYMANFIFLSYTLIYTPLKRKSSINTTIGAISGSLPPYLGWLAAGGDFINLMPIGICSYMFCWQYSHFYGILWIYQNDYRNAGFKMIDDPVKACKHLKIVLGIKVISGSLVFAGLNLNPFYVSNALLLYALWKFAYIPLKLFENDPSVKNAKNLKKMSYMHFMIFFGVVFLNNIWVLCEKYGGKGNDKVKTIENEKSVK